MRRSRRRRRCVTSGPMTERAPTRTPAAELGPGIDQRGRMDTVGPVIDRPAQLRARRFSSARTRCEQLRATGSRQRQMRERLGPAGGRRAAQHPRRQARRSGTPDWAVTSAGAPIVHVVGEADLPAAMTPRPSRRGARDPDLGDEDRVLADLARYGRPGRGCRSWSRDERSSRPSVARSIVVLAPISTSSSIEPRCRPAGSCDARRPSKT